MNGTDVTKLAADLAAGAITAAAIHAAYGPGVLAAVTAIVGGTIAGAVTSSVLDTVDKHTGMVSDIGGLVDDIMDLF